MVRSSFSIFHNNIVSINHNLENVELLLDELDFQFDVIGISETKITNSKESNPIRAFQVMCLSMCHHHWPLEALASLLINQQTTMFLKKLQMKHSKPSGLKSLLSTIKTFTARKPSFTNNFTKR